VGASYFAAERRFGPGECRKLRLNVGKLHLNGGRQACFERASFAMMLISLDPPHVETAPSGSTAAELQQRRVRAILWLTLIFWLSHLVMMTLAAALAHNPHVVQIGLVRLATTLVGLFLCYLIHLLLTKPFLSTTRKRFIALAIVAPILAEFFAWISFFGLAAVDPATTLKNVTWSGAVTTILFYTWFFMAWAGLYLAIAYGFDAQEEQQRTADIRELAQAAQLRALHSQINPHFLFNSLNSLSALILDGKMSDAEEMLMKLSNFLRMGLVAKPSERISLSSEVRFQQAYLELEQVRYADLCTEFHVPDELDSALVPALILQPIIENAVKYGVAGSPPPASIRVKAWSEEDRLFLQVTDSGKGQNSKVGGAGIGLSNVIERLRLIYGPNNVQLTAGRLPDGSFRAELSLPLQLS
jgi:signal transduction histidine kinase